MGGCPLFKYMSRPLQFLNYKSLYVNVSVLNMYFHFASGCGRSMAIYIYLTIYIWIKNKNGNNILKIFLKYIRYYFG